MGIKEMTVLQVIKGIRKEILILIAFMEEMEKVQGEEQERDGDLMDVNI